MSTMAQQQLVELVLGGGGEMGARMRAFDWSTTALGPLEQWPQSLRISVRIMLGSGYPMAICWGPDYTLLYNDAQRALFGTKHPTALGRRTRDMFPEAWEAVGPLYDRVMTHGQAYTTLTDQLFPLNRHNYLEECYFALSYSPIPDDSGHVGGVLATGMDTTERVIGDRRRQVLSDLASRTAEARYEDEIWRVSANVLGEHRLTIPFAFLYACRPAERTAYLVGPSIAPDALDPSEIDCTRQNLWGFDTALAKEGSVVELGQRASLLPSTGWMTPPERAAVAPIRLREESDAAGFLVLGIHPGRAFDDTYRLFLHRIAEQIAIGLASARAYGQVYRELGEREREWRMIVDSIPGLVATLTPAGEVENVNEQVLAYCGRTLEELKQWATNDTVHPDDLPRAIEVTSNSMGSGDPYEVLERVRRFDGVYRWFQVRGLPLRGSNGGIVRWYVLLTDIDDLKRAEALLDGEKRLLEMVGSGCALPEVLEAMCGIVERIVSHSTCSILLIEPNGTFRHGAGPSLPPGYDDVINGIPVVPDGGPCGAAASSKQQVIVPDLASDPRWPGRGWRTLVLQYGLKSVCSTPIVSLSGEVLGTFAIYQRESEPPSALQKDLIARFTHVASIAIDRSITEGEQKRAEGEIRALKDQLYRENLVLRHEVDRTSMFEEIVGASPALRPVLTRVAKVAQTDSTVLITGETGTGKELIARAIHRRSARASQGFVSVNCAATPRELIASELFGHERGAFTGATQRRLGRFELAHGGTIFLDEVGELPMEIQVALLRALQEREFERVGGSTPIRVDVRVIAATNRDLQAAIEYGTFRSDLLYRLNVFPIAVPALRERADDIPLLVEYFIDRYARKSGKTIRRVSKRTLDHLRAYPWPGNVRELQNVIERSVIVCDTDDFTVDESWVSARPSIGSRLALSGSLATHEKALIEDALRASSGRVFGPAGAAARLGIPRSTLESKIRALRINKTSFRARSA